MRIAGDSVYGSRIMKTAVPSPQSLRRVGLRAMKQPAKVLAKITGVSLFPTIAKKMQAIVLKARAEIGPPLVQINESPQIASIGHDGANFCLQAGQGTTRMERLVDAIRHRRP